MQILKFTPEEESTTKVPFVIKELPQSAEEITALIVKYGKKGRTSLVIKRLRDYHHPDGTLTEKTDKVQKW